MTSRGMRPDPPLSQCGTLKDIAAGIGITDQALYNLQAKYDTFPEPLRRVGVAWLYWTPEVEWFHREHGYGYGANRPERRRRPRSRA